MDETETAGRQQRPRAQGKPAQRRTRNRSNTLWIYLKSDCKDPFVSPSPAVFAPGEVFLIKNLTEGTAELLVGDAPIEVRGHNPFTKALTARVKPEARPGYYEYDIKVAFDGKRKRRHVRGGSQPGVIIDG